MNTQETKIKIITLGESSVGKTSIIQRICENTFNENVLSTIGYNFRFLRLYKKNEFKIMFY